MKNSNNLPWFRIIFGSLLVSIIASFHFNFLFQGNGLFYGFLAVFALLIYLSYKKNNKEEIRQFQNKTASILCFLLPVSAIIFSFVFTGNAVIQNQDPAFQAGSAVGGFIGGSIVTFFSFIVGLSLGIVFYLLSKPKHSKT